MSKSSDRVVDALIRAGEEPAIVVEPLWWQQTDLYWELPFYAEMGVCCWGLSGTPDWQPAREQLWAIQEDLA